MTKHIRGVLFDLDGTLLDTAPDLHEALNRVCIENDLPILSLSDLRAIVNLGSKALIRHVFKMDENDSKVMKLRESFLAYYEQNILNKTTFFPQMEQVLNYLDHSLIPWGIVTNKLTKHTAHLLKALNITHRPLCVICGDTLPTSKPHPAPILHACDLLQQSPEHCLYIGDAQTDVIASKAAGVKTLVALYGYIHSKDDPLSWKADGYIKEPIEIIDWMKQYPLS